MPTKQETTVGCSFFEDYTFCKFFLKTKIHVLWPQVIDYNFKVVCRHVTRRHFKSKDGISGLFSDSRFNVLCLFPNSSGPLLNHVPQRAIVSAKRMLGIMIHEIYFR